MYQSNYHNDRPSLYNRDSQVGQNYGDYNRRDYTVPSYTDLNGQSYNYATDRYHNDRFGNRTSAYLNNDDHRVSFNHGRIERQVGGDCGIDRNGNRISRIGQSAYQPENDRVYQSVYSRHNNDTDRFRYGSNIDHYTQPIHGRRRSVYFDRDLSSRNNDNGFIRSIRTSVYRPRSARRLTVDSHTPVGRPSLRDAGLGSTRQLHFRTTYNSDPSSFNNLGHSTNFVSGLDRIPRTSERYISSGNSARDILRSSVRYGDGSSRRSIYGGESDRLVRNERQNVPLAHSYVRGQDYNSYPSILRY